MCRNIRTLFNFEPPATDDEIQAASLQFVRKISGFTKPSKANEAAFDEAVAAIARISNQLLDFAGVNRRTQKSRGRSRAGKSPLRSTVCQLMRLCAFDGERDGI